MPQIAQFKKSYPYLAGILLGLLSAAILLGAFITYIRGNQQEQADWLFNQFNTVVEDFYGALIPLNALGLTTCDAENLRAMEIAQFNAVYPRQIMFYIEGDGACSTGSGMLDEPVRRPPPDIISPATGAQIWVNRKIILDLTGQPFTAIILKLGNYSAMVDPGTIALPDGSPFDWQILYREPGSPGQTIHVHGTQGLYLQDKASADFSYDSFFYHESCDTERTYVCLVQTTSTANIAREYANVFALFSLLSLALGSMSGRFVYTWQRRQLHMAARVLNGFRNDAYYWLFQPIFDMEKNRIIGCEVLSRFSDDYGDAMPDDYLPAIRDAGLTADFTRLMFRKILPDLDSRQDLPDGFRVSINIFPADIISGAINDIIRMDAVRQSRFALTLEITEEEYLDEIGGQDSLDKIREAGLSISIDDFGTGYSNLNQLKKLNCSYLKIDRSYIAELEHEPIKSSLIPHIVRMAEQLKLWAIAEGVETFEQMVILVGLGIRYGQGNLFGNPMTAAALSDHIEALVIGNSNNAVLPEN